MKKSNEEKFYTGKKIEEFTTAPHFLKWHKGLSILRKGGICLLSGEIEGTFREVREGWKFSLEEVIRISKRINGGGKISKICHVSEIMEFLQPILK